MDVVNIRDNYIALENLLKWIAVENRTVRPTHVYRKPWKDLVSGVMELEGRNYYAHGVSYVNFLSGYISSSEEGRLLLDDVVFVRDTFTLFEPRQRWRIRLRRARRTIWLWTLPPFCIWLYMGSLGWRNHPTQWCNGGGFAVGVSVVLTLMCDFFMCALFRRNGGKLAFAFQPFGMGDVSSACIFGLVFSGFRCMDLGA